MASDQDIQINEKQITFLRNNGHNHDGVNSALVYIPPGSVQGYHLASNDTSGSNGANGNETTKPAPIMSVGGTEVTGVVVQNLTATPGAAVGDIYVDIAWEPPAPQGGSDQVSQYQITLTELDNEFPTYAQTSATNYRMHNLKPSTQYSVEVQVIFNSGQLATPCTPITFSTGIDTTPPANMAGLEAYAGYTTITVNWTANTDAVMKNFSGSYEIDLAVDSAFNNVVQTQTTKGTVLSFGGLTTGQSYYVRGYAISYSGIKQPTPTVCSQNPITPGTATPSPSDGLAPTGSVAAPTCVGGPGYILVKWTPITNSDPVTYEVYASTSATFTPDTSGHTNYCGSTYSTGTGTSATGQFFAKNIDGTAFSYGTNYYFIVYAKDPDGYTTAGASAASAAVQMVQVTGSDIAVNTITANNIVSQTITASQIAANTITASQIASQTITASQIAAATITGDRISGSTITGSNIAGQTITASNIASATITATQIQSGTITATQLSASIILVGNQGIQSSNYSAGTAGWRIWTDGSNNGQAEFNGGTIRSASIYGGGVYGSTINTVAQGSTNNCIVLGSPSYTNYATFYDSSGYKGDIWYAGGQFQFDSNGPNAYLYINMPTTIEGALTVGNISGSAISGSSLSTTYGINGATLGVTGSINCNSLYWHSITDGGLTSASGYAWQATYGSSGGSLADIGANSVYWSGYGGPSSSEGIKNNITVLNISATELISDIPVYSYNYIKDKYQNNRMGMIAEHMPEDATFDSVGMGDYETSIKSIDLYSLIALLWKSNQEMNRRLKALEGSPIVISYVDAYLTGTVGITTKVDAVLASS